MKPNACSSMAVRGRRGAPNISRRWTPVAAWLLAVSALAASGCGRDEATEAAMEAGPEGIAAAFVARFGAHGAAVLGGTSRIHTDGNGLVLGRTADGGSALEATTADSLWIPTDPREALQLRFRDRVPLRVLEEGATGGSAPVRGAVSYAREGGRSYWTVTEGGFEEWLAIDEGRASADRPIARWRVEGMSLQELPEGVHVLDGGLPIAFVSAPRAWAADGEPIEARLAVEDEALVLYADAQGRAALVDPAWVATGSLSTGRLSHVLVPLADGALAVAGITSAPFSERYATATGVWSPAGTPATARQDHVAVVLPSGRVLVAGGWQSVVGELSSAEVWDPATNLWSPANAMGTARRLHAAAVISGRVLVTGGLSTPSSTELYSESLGTWTAAASMTTGRSRHTATVVGTRVLVAGGGTATAELYNLTTNTWSSAGTMSTGRGSHTATRLADGRVLVAGGYWGGALASAEIYDPATNTWSPAAPMAVARYAHTATLTSTGRVLVAGGSTGSSPADTALASTELYDPATNTWLSSPNMARSRSDHAAVRLATGPVLVAGGGQQQSGMILRFSELYVECGNGLVEPSEACDDGNLVGGDCCSSTCQLEPATTVCRAASPMSPCDAPETCTGTSPICPPNGYLPAGSVCRASRGDCDPAEVCSGSSATCPADALAPGTTLCRPSTGPCHMDDYCTGIDPACPGATYYGTLHVCRPAAGECDVEEYCSGGPVAACGPDLARAEGTACNAEPRGACDLQDRCAGTVGASAVCQPLLVAAGTVCHASAGECDPAELCSGTSPTCPPDTLASAGTSCRASRGDCDPPESCSGTTAACPNDVIAGGSVCRASTGECDLPEACNGTDASCPPDGAQPEGQPCGSPVSGPCDAPDTCVGTLGATSTCVARFLGPDVACRTGSCMGGTETLPASCSGSAASCEPPHTNLCDPYVCGADACLTSCGSDDDCTSGRVCRASVCVVPGPDAGPSDAGAFDAGSGDTGPLDSGPRDSGGVADARSDGGTPPPVSSGCACRASARDPAPLTWLALLGVVLGAVARRRR